MVSVEQATIEGIAFVLRNLRQSDRDEIAETTTDTGDMVLRSLTDSSLSWVVRLHGVPVIAFGCANVGPGVGSPWLLATDSINRLRVAFVRQSPQYVALMQAKFAYLTNYVDARNRLSIDWLKHVGFEFEDEPTPYGKSGKPFYRFWRG